MSARRLRLRQTPRALGAARGEIEFRGVSVALWRSPGAGGDRSANSGWDDGRGGGPYGSGKSTLVVADSATARSNGGRGAVDGVDLRDTDPADLRRQHRIRSAGDISVQRDRWRKHCVRRGERDRGTDPSRGGDRGSGWRHRKFSEGIRHHGRRTRDHALGRAEAAGGDRARDLARSADFDSGRCAYRAWIR